MVRRRTAPPPGADAWQLSGVSCTSPAFCLAVGGWSANLPLAENSLVEVWNGSQWTVAGSLVFPAFSSLSAVSCASSTSCMAVGSDGFPIAVQWDGSTATSTASRPSASAQVNSVSCAGSTCIAVGFQFTNLGLATYASGWNGSSWSDLPTPNAASAANSRLDGVSCASTTHCFAVGSSNDGSGNGGTLVEMWNGAAWSIQSSPNQPGAPSSSLDAVSCPSPASCTAVGWWVADLLDTGTLGEVWTG